MFISLKRNYLNHWLNRKKFPLKKLLWIAEERGILKKIHIYQ